MKIVVISPYPVFPENTGAATRISAICNYLSSRGHELILFTPLKNNYDDHMRDGVQLDGTKSDNFQVRFYRSRTRFHHFLNIGFAIKLARELRSGVDLILLSFPYQGLMVALISMSFGVPLFFDEHNVEFLRFKRMGKHLVSKVLYYEEKFLVRKSKVNFCVSELDREIIKRSFGADAVVVPNGVDTRRFCPNEVHSSEMGFDGKKIVLFFGGLEYLPNKEAVKLINDFVAPEVSKKDSEVQFLIVGREPPKLDYCANVKATGSVEEIEDIINLADLVIVPLAAGGGTRFKIIESIACGKVVLSTPVGAEGLDIEDGKNIFLSEIENFPERILEILNMPDLSDLKMEARSKAIEYDWRNVLCEMEKHLGVVDVENPSPCFS